MGRGRKAQPTALKILQGNPGKRQINTEEPEYESGAPKKPAWLDAHSSEEWDRLCEIMMQGRLLTKADYGIMTACVLAYSQMIRNELVLQQLGDMYQIEDPWGGKIPKARPESIRAETSRRQYVSFLAEMGQTTVSQTKVKAIPETKESGISKFLTRRG